MSVSIRPCPKCSAMLLGDSPHCMFCGAILDKTQDLRFAVIPDSEIVTGEPELPCHSCGEMVRDGLVRCWKCGSFMRPELADAYREMQASPAPIVFSKVAEGDNTVRLGGTTPTVGDEDDFEFGTGLGAATSEVLDDASNVEVPVAEATVGEAPAGTEEFDPSQYSPEVLAQWAAYYAQFGYTIPGYEHLLQQPQEESSESQGAAGYTLQQEVTAQAESTSESSTETPAASPIAAGSDISHSEATAGDVLFKAALEEEAIEAKRGGRSRRLTQIPGSLIVYCANGHKIVVQERHRGRAGRCPQCKTLFFVPAPVTEIAQETPPTETGPQSGVFKDWIFDVRGNLVNQTKLKLKPGSLETDYDTVDIAFSPENVLFAIVFKGGTAFRAMQESRKKPVTRQELYDYLLSGKPLDKLPVPRHVVVPVSELGQLKIVQPFAANEESIFAGIPVFGAGRIALRLPSTAGQADRDYVSMNLSQYRQFANGLEKLGRPAQGEELGVPLQDRFTEMKCHYNETPVKSLSNIEYYQADPQFKLVISGRQCASCGLIVSEDARKKEKIGGANASGIAKAKCPKCQQKFGTTTFWSLAEETASTPPAAM